MNKNEQITQAQTIQQMICWLSKVGIVINHKSISNGNYDGSNGKNNKEIIILLMTITTNTIISKKIYYFNLFQ